MRHILLRSTHQGSVLALVGLSGLWGSGCASKRPEFTGVPATASTTTRDSTSSGSGERSSEVNSGTVTTDALWSVVSDETTVETNATTQTSAPGTTASVTPASTTLGSTAIGTPIPMGTPATLVSGLVFPGRVGLYEEHIYVNNRPSFSFDAPEFEPDAPVLSEIIEQAVHAAGLPRVLVSTREAHALAVLDDSVWVAGGLEGFLRHDLATGELLQHFAAEDLSAYALTYNADWMFLAWSNGNIERVPRQGQTREALLELGSGYPHWVSATDSHMVVVMIDGEEPSQVHVVDLQNKASTLLYAGDHDVGSAVFFDPDVLFTDATQGALMRVPIAGGSPVAVANVGAAWGVVVEGGFAYVSVRPQDCAQGTEGAVVRVALGDGATVELANTLPCPSMLLTAPEGLYWVNNGQTSYDEAELVHASATGSVMFLPR